MSNPDTNANPSDVLLERERLLEDAAELVSELMERSGLSQKDIAARIGKSKGFVSQVLSGQRNMTLKTLADFAGALGFRIALDATPLSERRRYRTHPVAARPVAPRKRDAPTITWGSVDARTTSVMHYVQASVTDDTNLALLTADAVGGRLSGRSRRFPTDLREYEKVS